MTQANYQAELILPLAVAGTYSYALTEELGSAYPELAPGCRVVVPFGAKRYYTALILSIAPIAPGQGKRLKPIEQILDERPLIPEQQLKQWQWMSSYYCCPLGSVLRVALPSALLPESKTMLLLNPDFEASEALPSLAYAILDALHTTARPLDVQQLEQQLGRRLTQPLLQLLSLGAITTEEQLQSKYKPRMERYLRLAEPYRSDEALLSEAYAKLGRAPKQAQLLERFLELIEAEASQEPGIVHRSQLLEYLPQSNAPLKALIDKGLLEQLELATSRLTPSLEPREVLPEVAPAKPLEQPVSLYWGTSRAASEDFIIAQVQRTLSEGKQVLLLSPSTAASSLRFGLQQRLERLFPGLCYPYHSLLSEARRVETYRRLSEWMEPALVFGTRTAIFLPLPRLGLIIVDEEHEYLYKQQLLAPRYHARDVALWRGHQQGAQVLLCSETPSAEVLFHALRGKYALIRPQTVVDQPPLPVLQLIDLAGLRRSHDMPYGSLISPPLYTRLQQALAEGRPVLLLQNRRGYAPYLLCDQCGERVLCPNCDVSLTYHRARHALLCHYCGHSAELPERCPHCGAHELADKRGELRPALRQVGYGIERVEEELRALFPDKVLLRIDSDTLSSRKRQAEIQQQLDSGRVDILLGTQLIKSQAVWEDLALVAIIQLDALLGFPDFRSEERAFQLLYQLRLRAAAGAQQPTDFYLQTASPEHPFVQDLRGDDYERFIMQTLQARQELRYPPFWRMSYIWLRAKDPDLLARVGLLLSQYLKGLLPGELVSDALVPEIGRVEGFYQRRIVVRRPYRVGPSAERAAYEASQAQLLQVYPEASRVQIYFDIDPL